MLKNKISWWKTEFGSGEIAQIKESIRTKNISQGKIANQFEKKFAQLINMKYSVSVSSGTSALYTVLFALGIKKGDEVIIPDKTWIATAHAIYMLGAKVVTVDVKEKIPLIDEEKIEKKITNKTKVIIPVHLNGRECNMKKINNNNGDNTWQ